MNQRYDPFQGEIWKDRLVAIGSSWKAILLILMLGVGALMLGRSASRTAKAPAKEEMGRVIRFGSYADEMGDQPLIIVELSDGTKKQLMIWRPQLQTCRVGDRIRLVRKAGVLRVHTRGCMVDEAA